jgi:hypothetical protein
LELLMEDIGSVEAGESPVDFEALAIHGVIPSGAFGAQNW